MTTISKEFLTIVTIFDDLGGPLFRTVGAKRERTGFDSR